MTLLKDLLVPGEYTQDSYNEAVLQRIMGYYTGQSDILRYHLIERAEYTHRLIGMQQGIAIGVQAALELLGYPVGGLPDANAGIVAQIHKRFELLGTPTYVDPLQDLYDEARLRPGDWRPAPRPKPAGASLEHFLGGIENFMAVSAHGQIQVLNNTGLCQDSEGLNWQLNEDERKLAQISLENIGRMYQLIRPTVLKVPMPGSKEHLQLHRILSTWHHGGGVLQKVTAKNLTTTVDCDYYQADLMWTDSKGKERVHCNVLVDIDRMVQDQHVFLYQGKAWLVNLEDIAPIGDPAEFFPIQDNWWPPKPHQFYLKGLELFVSDLNQDNWCYKFTKDCSLHHHQAMLDVVTEGRTHGWEFLDYLLSLGYCKKHRANTYLRHDGRLLLNVKVTEGSVLSTTSVYVPEISRLLYRVENEVVVARRDYRDGKTQLTLGTDPGSGKVGTVLWFDPTEAAKLTPDRLMLGMRAQVIYDGTEYHLVIYPNSPR